MIIANTEQSIFQDVESLEHLAKLLNTSAKQLRYLLYVRAESERYTTFNIKKRSVGFRTIKAPRHELKIIQRYLADFLQDRITTRPAVHGFVRERSIVTNAKLHVSKRMVLNVDLKDFFPSINFGRVRGLFMSKPFGASPKVATVLAQICCYENTLPQGAPTSPVIANLICYRMDAQLQRLAFENYCLYTRYADDMTFSKQTGEFSPELVSIKEDGTARAGEKLREIVEDNGFFVHPHKVHLYRNYACQSVTGLTVNTRVNVPRKFIRDIRAMICDWRVHGLDAAEERHHKEFYRHPCRHGHKPPLKRIIEGKLNFLRMVSGIDDPVRKNLQQQLLNVWPDYLEVMDKENMEINMHDFFISHASEDKDGFVRPLVDALISKGMSVWYDEYMLTIGDNLYQKINEGLKLSRYAIVVLSPAFFNVKKTWPDREVSSIFALEDSDKRSRTLQIWHNVSQQNVAEQSPLLAGNLAWKSSDFTPEQLAAKFAEFIKTRRK